jgi:GNAT superfamily N-acetyltransferase
MSIRITTHFTGKEHGAALLELMTEYARHLTGKQHPLPENVSQNLVKEVEQRPNINILLAYEDEVPVGFAVTIDSFSTFACKPVMNIHDIFVVRKHRGQGVAMALLEKIESLARDAGCCKLTLEVLENNRPALNLYHRFGFSPHSQDPTLGKGLFYDKTIC